MYKRQVTSFDLRIRSWDYGCETVIVDRRRAASAPNDEAVSDQPPGGTGAEIPAAGNDPAPQED